MELTSSFLDMLPHFARVFTAPTYRTFVVIVAGWVLSQRHHFIAEVIFSGGHVGIDHPAAYRRSGVSIRFGFGGGPSAGRRGPPGRRIRIQWSVYRTCWPASTRGM